MALEHEVLEAQDVSARRYQLVRSTGIALDPGLTEPFYRQIFDQVVARIQSGAFPPGYRLPATRALAVELRTHRNTVVRAFEELADAGFVVSTVGRGTFVAQAVPAQAAAEPPVRAHLPWSSLASQAVAAEPLGRLDRYARPAAMAQDAVNLSRMQPSEDLLPSALLQRCIDHVLRTRKASALGYAPREGLPRLREVIVSELARIGVPAQVDDILVTTGSQQALDLIARALIDPGDPFLVEESTYNGAINLLGAAGARVVGVPSDDLGPDLMALASHARSTAKGFYLMPNSGNPTGSCIPAERREQLVEWSHQAGVPLIEDDYGADLNLEGHSPPAALRALDSEVIYVGTFSKKLIPALRVGFMVCPEALRRQLVPLKHAMDLGTSILLQYALCEFIGRGYLQAHLRRTVSEYRARRDALVAALREGLPEEVEWTTPAHGVVLWLLLPTWMDPTDVLREAEREGVLVTPGVLYSASGTDRRGLRLTYCGEPTERVAAGGRRLCRAMQRVFERSEKRDRPSSMATVEVV